MKIKFVVWIVSCCLLFFAAQKVEASVWKRTNEGMGEERIIGKIIDGSKKTPVGFASIALLKPDSSMVGGVVADENGAFSLTGTAPGNYLLRITFVGYNSLIVENVDIQHGIGTVDLGAISIAESSQNLNEVVVRGEKTMIVNDIDKKIVNVGKDLLATSNNVSELLEKLPAVSLDENGNPQLRGNGNLVVLIDGKPSTQYGSDLPTVLQSFPADLIERIEVMTTPSAKYEGEGASGVIDIITKKSKIRGVSGGLRGSIGNRWMNSESGHFNFKQGKWGIKASANAQKNVMSYRRTLDRHNYLGETPTILQQRSVGGNKDQSLFGRIGVDYELDKKNSFSGMINYSHNHNSSATQAQNITTLEDHSILKQFERLSTGSSKGGNVNANLDYRHQFAKDHVLTFSASYSDGNSEGRSDYDQQSDSEELVLRQYSQKQGNHVFVLAFADYTWPIAPKSTLEVGIRARRNDKKNDNSFYNYQSDSSSFVVNPALSNVFGYKDALYTGYMSFTQKTDLWGFRGGLRVTDATQNINQINLNREFDVHFLTLVPTLALTRKLSEETQVRLNYSRTVQRPQADMLNPYVDASDPRNIKSGNPNLKPEFIHKAELGYSNYKQNGGWGPSLFVDYSNNAVTQIKTIDEEGISYSKFDNVGMELSYGFETDFSTKITDKFKINASGRVFRNEVVSVVADIDNQAWSYSGNLNAFFELPLKLRGSAYVNYEGPRAIAQGVRQGVFVANMGLRRDLMERKASVSFSFQDLFLSRAYKSQLETSTYWQHSLWQRTNRVLNLTFQYRFGKISAHGSDGDV